MAGKHKQMVDVITNFSQCRVRGFELLNDRCKRDYRRVCEQMMEKQTLRAADLQIVMGYARACEDIRLADEAIAQTGLLLSEFDRNGHGATKSNPAVKVKYDALKEMRAFALMLGITPLGRKRLNDAAVSAKNPLEEWLKEDE